MIDELFTRVRTAVADVDAEVAKRRAVSTVDAVADGMAFAAQEFRATLDDIERDTEEISTEQYAELHGVTPQTVGNWIRRGELKATREGHAWQIRRNATRTLPTLELAG